MMKVSSQTLDAISFVAVNPSFDCHYIDVWNMTGQVMLVRSDPADAATEIIVQNLQKVPNDTPAVQYRTNFRYVPTAPLYYAKLSAGTGSIKKIHDAN